MKKILLFLCLFTMVNRLHSQSLVENMNSYIPPSPEAASLVSQNSNYSVDYYTGKMNYSAPISIVNLGGLNFDLGLQYSTSGFKVQDMSGSTGLGWRTNFGGVITRYVEGLPDEEDNGYCGKNRIGAKSSSTLNADYFSKITNAEWDAQPDKFYFSFFGLTGTIRLDPDGTPILESSMSGVKIEYNPFNRANGRMNGGAEEWILRDQNGNQYFFGSNGSTEVTTSTSHGETKNVSKTFISSWYISKIITNKKKTVYFTYLAAPAVNYTFYVNVYRNTSVTGPCSYNGPAEKTWNENVDIQIEAPRHLSKVQTEDNETKIYFGYADREDLNNAKALSDIQIVYNNKVKKTFLFDYTYFTSTDGNNAKRLKLQDIKQRSSTGAVNTLYQFNYYESVILPARNSIKTDYWGYYNNNNGSSNIQGYLNGSKNPDRTNTQACVLKKVINSTGGAIYFDYEQNRYKKDNADIDAGGLRIQRKYERTSDSPYSKEIMNEEYSYLDPVTPSLSSGQLYLTQQNDEIQTERAIVYVAPPGVLLGCNFKNYYKYSEPLLSILDLNETSVGYSVVSIKRLNGTTRYAFSNFSERNDIFNQSKYDTQNNQENPQGSTNFNVRPLFPPTSFAFARGKIQSEELFDLNNQKVKVFLYEYQDSPSYDAIIGIKAYAQGFLMDKVYYNFGRYRLFNQDSRLVRKTDITFINGAYASSSAEDYSNSNFIKNLVYSKQITNVAGKTSLEDYKFPYDDLTDDVRAEMYNTNRVAVRVEQANFNTGYLVKKEKVNYSRWPSGIIAPSSVEEEYNSGEKKTTIIFNNYDDNGNILESQTPGGIKEVYLWGYNSEYLVAKIVGAEYNTVKNYVDMNMLKNADDYTSQQIIDELNKIRTNIPGAQVITYTHDPLVGVTSKTDARGETIYYEYDDFQRLEFIMDQDHNIVKSFKYNYMPSAQL